MLIWKIFGPIFLVLCLKSSESIRWPAGKYGIPKPASGCPHADGFQWETGWRSQDMNNEYSNSSKSIEFHLDGVVDEKKINRSFCMKTDGKSQQSRPSWPPGQYCIYNSGGCPEGLTKGYVKWDDDDDEYDFNAKGGTLPGGRYVHNTEIRFCCRTNGSKSDPILLPSQTPFFLLAYGSAECQMVKWTVASLEWIFFDTEANRNSDKAGGAYPFEAGIKHPTIYYCYYRGCNETLTGVDGTFHSPNYPRKYPDGQYCSWRITVGPAQLIHLIFTNFSLQSENNTDGLYVYDGQNTTGEVLGVFYGGHPPPKEGICSSSNHMLVIFKSGKNGSYGGFSASYSESDCVAPTAATSAVHTPEVTSPSTVKPGTLPTVEKRASSKEPALTSTDRLSDKEATELNKAFIYGPIVGVLFVVLTVFLICTVWRLRKRQRDNRQCETPAPNQVTELRETNDEYTDTGCCDNPGHYMDLIEATQSPGQLEETTMTETSPDTEVHEYTPLHPGTRSWEVPREKVIIDKIIGKGAFGQVAQGKSFELRGGEKTATVAIKMLKDNAPETDRKDLLSELEVMKKLKPHPHVIKLLGCVTESEPLLVIIEYVPYGDLLGYLRKSRGLYDTYYKDPDVKPQTTLTSQQLMTFSWQVADGMRYLSSRNIIHRDLAARNVLVGEEERCKVTDFGMARDVHQENIYEMKRKGRLPVKWTAYEGLLYGLYTTKSDVWSYGVLLYEIFTVGGSPYPRMDGRRIVDLLQQGYRMPKPTHVDDSLYKIMRMCWQEDPRDRPTFENLTIELKEMEKQHKRLINMQDYDTALYENVEDLMF